MASFLRSPLPGAFLLWSSVAALALLGPSRALLLPSLIPYSAAFLALLHLWRRHPGFLDDGRTLLGGAILLRLTLFPSLPDLSDDLYRYLWDGWMTYAGINPFRFVPSDPALAPFQASHLFREMNSPEYHSIYPPLSQIVFLLGGTVYAHAGWPAAAYAVKGGFLALEMSGVCCLFLALRAMGRRPGVLGLYAWNPLVIVTIAGSGHSEGGLLLGLGLLAYGVAGGGRTRAWIGLVLAGASKGIPLLLGPLLLRRQWAEARRCEGVVESRGRTSGKLLAAATPALLLGLVLLVPFYFDGLWSTLAASADLYVRLFEFNAGPYLLLKEFLLALTGEDHGKVLGPGLRWLFLGGAVLIWLRAPVHRAEDWFRASLLLLGLYLVTATTVHPWYLIWGLAFIPFTPQLRPAWLWASWAAFLTYFTYTGVPHGPLTALFWIGASALVLWEWEREIRDRLLRWAGRRKARQIEPYLVGSRVLDLGAGEGYVASPLLRNGRALLLMDVGPYFRVSLPGIVYDGTRIPLGNNSVDTVLISLALHHAHDPEQVIAEALRVARRRVVITESTYRWRWERRGLEIADRWANRRRGWEEDAPSQAPLRFRTVPDWEETFRRAGAQVVRSRRLNRIGHRHHLFVLEP